VNRKFVCQVGASDVNTTESVVLTMRPHVCMVSTPQRPSQHELCRKQAYSPPGGRVQAASSTAIHLPQRDCQNRGLIQHGQSQRGAAGPTLSLTADICAALRCLYAPLTATSRSSLVRNSGTYCCKAQGAGRQQNPLCYIML